MSPVDPDSSFLSLSFEEQWKALPDDLRRTFIMTPVWHSDLGERRVLVKLGLLEDGDGSEGGWAPSDRTPAGRALFVWAIMHRRLDAFSLLEDQATPPNERLMPEPMLPRGWVIGHDEDIVGDRVVVFDGPEDTFVRVDGEVTIGVDMDQAGTRENSAPIAVVRAALELANQHMSPAQHLGVSDLLRDIAGYFRGAIGEREVRILERIDAALSTTK